MSGIKVDQYTKSELKAIFAKEHRWELKRGLEVCFGVKPSFDWNDSDSFNENIYRVYNWCCKYLNGGEAKNPKAPEMTRLNGSGSDVFYVLRDELIVLGHVEWPDFFEKVYRAWVEYREERDGPKMSELEKKAISGQRLSAILEYRQHKNVYDSGHRKWRNKGYFADVAAERLGINVNTTRRAASKYRIDLSLKWAREHEAASEYQNISWEIIK